MTIDLGMFHAKRKEIFVFLVYVRKRDKTESISSGLKLFLERYFDDHE